MFLLNKMKNKMYLRNLKLCKKINQKFKKLTLIDSRMLQYFCSSLQLQVLMIKLNKIKITPNQN